MREIIKRMPAPIVKYEDKPFTKQAFGGFERTLDCPVILKEERLVEIPERMPDNAPA